jgi:hypothetical protein
MMTRRELIVALGAAAVAMPAFAAADQTYKGEMVCAKCFLKRPDAKECQDVLMVGDAKKPTAEYYVTKNDVSKETGEACMEPMKVTMTGTVSEKDGRKWITASKIVKEK